MAENVIEISGLDFNRGDHPILTDVNLRVARGEFMAVVGPNGGGKTTLLELVLGLLVPARGGISVFGMSPARARSRLGYVPQSVTARISFPVKVQDVVLMGLANGSKWAGYSRGQRKRANESLERVGLAGRGNKRFNELSGGQRQRVLIARALMSDAPLLLLDEPTANIDPQGVFCFFDFINNLRKTRDLTIVVVSHDLSAVSTCVDSVACVNHKLISSPKAEMTDEMFELLYGVHDHACPMEGFVDHQRNVFRGGRHA